MKNLRHDALLMAVGCLVSFGVCMGAQAQEFCCGESESGGEARQGAAAIFALSRDNEGFVTQRAGLAYLPEFNHAQMLTGLRYIEHHYEQNAWSRNGRQLSFLQRRINPETANGWQAEAGVFHQGRHDLLTLDASYRLAPNAQTGVEMLLNRDWVETANGLDKGVHFTFAGLVLDYTNERRTAQKTAQRTALDKGAALTLVGLGGLQRFSDGNLRKHGRFKLILQPDTELGLNFQIRYRAYTSSSRDVGGAYFNPERYHEAMLAANWRTKVNGWPLSLTAGAGRQKVGTDPDTSAHLFELVLQSPAWHKNYSFQARAGRSRSASFNGPAYSYNYVQGEWILVW